MRKDYYIDVILQTTYNEDKIKILLEKGYSLGFIYYDYIFGERYETSPILNPHEAFNKLITIKKNKEKEEHFLYIEISKGHFANLSFNESIDGLLEFDIYIPSYRRDKVYKDMHTGIELSFYLDIVMKLSEDFGIEGILADYLKDYQSFNMLI